MDTVPQLRCFLENGCSPHVITELILSSQNALFSRNENILGMKTFLVIARHEKEKT